MERRPTGTVPASARTAVVWEVLRAEVARYSRSLSIVDVGGGTGGFAVPLARDGHQITVVDSSPDALAALIRRADEAGVGARVRAVQGDAHALGEEFEPGSVDIVLCHSVLEVVDSPAAVAAEVATALRPATGNEPGGTVSVLVAGRVAAVLAKAMSGQLAAAAALLTDSDASAGRRFDVEAVTTLLTSVGLTVDQIHGVRVVADLVPGAVAEREHEALIAFELAAAGQSPYRDLAAQLHVLARRG